MRIVKYRLHFLLAILFVALYSGLHAQQASADFIKINKAYEQAGNMRMKVNYALFKSWTSTELIQQEQGEIKKKGFARLYSRVGQTETVRNEDYFVLANHQDKQIVLLDVQMSERAPDVQLSFGRLDTLLSYCKQVIYNKEGERLASYTLSFDGEQEYGKIRISFDTRTYFIHKICFYYNKPVEVPEGDEITDYKTRLEITYSDISSGIKLSDADFTYNKYLRNEKGGLLLKKEFSNYRFINQYKKNRKTN